MKASTFAIFLTFAVILAAASAQEEAQEVSDIENEFLGELDTDTDPDTTDVEENQQWGSRARRRRRALPAVDGKKGSLGAYGCKVSGKFLGDHMQYGGRCNNRCPGWVCGHCRTINSDQSGTCKNSGNCAGIGSCCNDIFNKARGCLSAKTAGACSAAGARAKFGNTHGCTWVAPPIPRKTNCLRYAYQNGHYRQRFHEGCSTFRGSKSSCHAHCNKASNSASRAACRNGCDWMTCDGAGFGNHKYGCNTASPRYKSCGGNIWCSPEVASGEMEEDADVSAAVQGSGYSCSYVGPFNSKYGKGRGDEPNARRNCKGNGAPCYVTYHTQPKLTSSTRTNGKSNSVCKQFCDQTPNCACVVEMDGHHCWLRTKNYCSSEQSKLQNWGGMTTFTKTDSSCTIQSGAIPPAIDVTQRLAAHTAVSAGKMKATKAATKASQCASDETFFWCQNNGKSTDKYDYCGDNSKCPVNGVHRNRCCYCGGCLKAV